jgi:hypothetical protein
VDEVIKLAEAEDPVLAGLIIQAKEFGLRAQESLSLDPHESDGGNHLRVLRGAKGGRQRAVRFEPFGDASLRKVLDELQNKNPDGIRGWKGLTTKQARRRMYYLLGKLGITRRELGVTLHGLRTQFAIEKFESIAGVQAPVRGGQTINFKALDEVRRQVSQALGHNRMQVTAAYYGSFDKMAKVARQRFTAAWQKLQVALPAIQELVRQIGLHNLWLVGPLAQGEGTSRQVFEFFIDRPDALMLERTGLMSDVYSRLCAAAESSLGYKVIVHFATPGRDLEEWATTAVPLLYPEPPCLADHRPQPAAQPVDVPALAPASDQASTAPVTTTS